MAVAVSAIHIPVPSFLSNVFNPFAWFAGALHGLVQEEVGLFQQAITNPPPQPSHGFTDYLYGNALGLAGVLSIAICFVLVAFMIVSKRIAVRATYAFAIALGIGAFGWTWFAGIDWLLAAGTQLAHAMQFYHPHGSGASGSFLTLPNTTNPLQQIMSFGAIWGMGSALVIVMFSYSIVIVMVKFLGLLALALYPLGERSQRFLMWIISLGLVATVFGRPVAILTLEVGKIVYDANPLHNWFFQTIMLIATFIVAILAQFALIIITHNTVENVHGRVRSQVTGVVTSVTKDFGSEGSASYNAGNAAAMGGPVSASSTALKEAGAGVGLAVAARAVGAGGGPVGLVAATALSTAASRRGAHSPTPVPRSRREE